jgi:hypothetical protein
MTQVATSAADSDRSDVIADRLIAGSMAPMTAFCQLRVVTLVSHSPQRSNHEHTSQAEDDYPDAEHGDH